MVIYCYKILLVQTYSCFWCINIHIKCSVVRLEITQRVEFVWSNWLQVHINLYHISRLLCLSINPSVYDIMDTSKQQKTVINKILVKQYSH